MAYIDANILAFTPAQLDYFEVEMKKYKVPWLYKIVYGYILKVGAIIIPLMILIIIVLGMFYGSGHYPFIWPIIKGIAFTLIFGVGGLVLISFLWNRIKILIDCKRLGLTLKQWNTLAIAFQITYTLKYMTRKSFGEKIENRLNEKKLK